MCQTTTTRTTIEKSEHAIDVYDVQYDNKTFRVYRLDGKLVVSVKMDDNNYWILAPDTWIAMTIRSLIVESESE